MAALSEERPDLSLKRTRRYGLSPLPRVGRGAPANSVRPGARVRRQLLIAFVVSAWPLVGAGEEIAYGIYSVPLIFGDAKLVAEGRRVYSHGDVRTSPGPAPKVPNWTKTLTIANGFVLGASVYREAQTEGFGLWIRKDGGGFSWGWFERESNGIVRKLPGSGKLRVRVSRVAGLEEMAEIEFLDDVTMRLDRYWLIPFFDKDTDRLVIRKGSVPWLAP